MKSVHAVHLVTTQQRTVDAVSAMIVDQPTMELAGVCRSVPELESRLAASEASLVLVDLDPVPARMLDALRDLANRHPRVPVVVLCGVVEGELVLQAMRAGARHFVPKDSLERDLPDALRRVMPQNGTATPASRGRIVTVLSEGGGCGATTLAVNIASELGELAGTTPADALPDRHERVLLVDLDHAYGAAATGLNVGGAFGVADVGAHESIDAELIRSTAIPRGDRLALLVSAATTGRPHRPEAADTRSPVPMRTLEACRSAYAWTVLDAPRVDAAAAAQLIARSAVTLLVMQLSVKDVRLARAMSLALVRQGVDPAQLLYVANRYRRWAVGLSLAEASHALGAPVRTLPNDYKRVAAAANHGKTLAEYAPRSPVRRELRRGAQQWHTQEASHTTGDPVMAGVR